MPALQVEDRDVKKTKPTHLRREGIIPLALTRRDHTTINLQAPVEELKAALKHADGHGRFEVKLSGEKTIKVILKQQTYDWLHHKPLSATLQEVGEDDVLKLDVPVISVGSPEAVTNGEAMLTQPTSHVRLRGKVADMPEQIEIDVSQLGIGDSIPAHSVQLPAGVDLLSAPDATLFTVQVIRAITEAELTPSVEGEEAEAAGEAAEEAVGGEEESS
jgi:large subunit ribosomal protein L25